jgi:hypothetical protein
VPGEGYRKCSCEGIATAGAGADSAGVEPVPDRQTSSRRDGLRALVELASGDVAGQPDRFLLPNGPREAAVLAGVGTVRKDRPADLTSGLLAVFAVVIGAYSCAVATMAPGLAAAMWAAVFVAISWAAARALFRALTASVTGARARGRFVALSREDSKRIAGGAACAFADLLRADDCDADADAAFGSYHEVLVSLARFELAAGQAVAADRNLARLLRDDPLRSVAGQMAQDKAVRAVAHRAAARAAADKLQAALRSRQELDRATRPPGDA